MLTCLFLVSESLSQVPAQHSLPLPFAGRCFSINSSEEALGHRGVKSFVPGAAWLGGGQSQVSSLGPDPRAPSVMSPSPGKGSVAPSMPPPATPGQGVSLFSQMFPSHLWLLSWNESHFPVLTLSNLPPCKTQAMTSELNHGLPKQLGT